MTARMLSRRALIEELVFGALTLSLLIPLWSVRYPPFQDFPQYVALARTLADYKVAALGFERYFTLNFDTYVLFAPWLGAAFAKIFDPLVAAKLVVSIAILATPWGLRVLLRTLGRPVAYAYFALPLAYNAHVVMGFVSYVLGVALMMWGLAFGALLLAEPRRRWQIALGITSVLCLYSHVVPWAFSVGGFGLAVLVTVPWRRWLAVLLPLAPALLLSLRGFFEATTGWNTLMVGMAKPNPNCPIYDPTRVVFEQIPGWINDVFSSEWDEQLLIGLYLLGMLLVLLGSNVLPIARREAVEAADAENAADVTRVRRTGLCYALLAPMGVALYFIMPRTCDWIWPIHARFLFIGVMLSVLILPMAPRSLLRTLTVGLALISLVVTIRTTSSFRDVESELGDLEPALAKIPLGHTVVALTLFKTASAMRLAGFHHFGAYCQAERGGLTTFSFATMAHWPIRIRPELKVPEATWQLQFDPAAVSVIDVGWAEYVLTRGQAPAAVPLLFKPVYLGTHWQVWKADSRRLSP